jgi:single-strand DNA-binding protein
MAGFNRVLLLGNLTRDPQMRYLPNQNPVTDFGLACNRRFKTATGEQRDEATFVDCTAFGRQAEVINQYCTKGKQILIEGRLKYDTWEDKNGGGKRSKLSVVVETFQFIGPREGGAPAGADESAGQDEPPARPARSGPPPRASAPAQAPTHGDEPSVNQDDIPF